MGKKILTSGIIAIILFFTTAFCYATEGEDKSNSNTMNLGDQITESMNKVEKSAENLTNDVKNNNAVENTMNNVKNTVNGAMNTIDNKMNSNYNTTRTNLDTEYSNNEMTETTWIWIVLAVVGIVILATVWFYAMQNSGND